MQVSLNYDTAVILTTLGIPIGLSFISATISKVGAAVQICVVVSHPIPKKAVCHSLMALPNPPLFIQKS
jgi:hypothetical protein